MIDPVDRQSEQLGFGDHGEVDVALHHPGDFVAGLEVGGVRRPTSSLALAALSRTSGSDGPGPREQADQFRLGIEIAQIEGKGMRSCRASAWEMPSSVTKPLSTKCARVCGRWLSDDQGELELLVGKQPC